ncbi:MAG: Flp family type IVb pilin [Alphaproteobacteria bacterium]|jgi:pilus assembly protein Flp/PilA|nr:Flp family type IVb pilin [Alphaproteobacteria bacterium]
MLKLLAIAYAKKEDGATAIEYGLIAAGIALAIAAAVFAFGEDLTALFEDMGSALEGTTS